MLDCLLKFLQRIRSSVVDSLRKPRAIRISSVVDCLRKPMPGCPSPNFGEGSRELPESGLRLVLSSLDHLLPQRFANDLGLLSLLSRSLLPSWRLSLLPFLIGSSAAESGERESLRDPRGPSITREASPGLRKGRDPRRPPARPA